MRTWVASEEVDALSEGDDWPTAETAALWRRFRESMLGERFEAWSTELWKRALDLPVGKAPPPPGVYRIEIDAALAQTWLVTPDFQRVARFKKSIRDRLPSVWMGRLLPGRTVVEATRWGRSKATWPKANI